MTFIINQCYYCLSHSGKVRFSFNKRPSFCLRVLKLMTWFRPFNFHALRHRERKTRFFNENYLRSIYQLAASRVLLHKYFIFSVWMLGLFSYFPVKNFTAFGVKKIAPCSLTADWLTPLFCLSSEALICLLYLWKWTRKKNSKDLNILLNKMEMTLLEFLP